MPPPPEGAFPTEPGPVGPASVEELLADALVEDAVEGRRRERWLRRRLAEEASVAGALSGAVGTQVLVHLLSGQRLRGVVGWVGHDVVELAPAPGTAQRCWVALAAVAGVEADHPLAAAGPPTADRTLAEVLTDLCDSGLTVVVGLLGGSEVSGELTSVGDTLGVRGPGGRRWAYLSPGAVASVSLAS